MMRKLPVAICGLLLLASCGRATSPAALTEQEALSAEASLVALESAVNGSADQLRAVEQLQYLGFQSRIQTCMQAQGFSYTPPPPPRGTLGWITKPFAGGFDALAPADDGVTRGGMFTADWRWEQTVLELAEQDSIPNPGFTSLTSDEDRDAYTDVGDACGGTSAPPVDTPSNPDALEAVYGFFGEIENDDRVTSLMKGYPDCMSGNGFDVTNRQEVRDLLDALYMDPETGFGYPLDDIERVDAARLTQVRAAEADADCRSDAHAVALALFAERYDQFIAEFGSHVDEQASAWDAIVEQRDQLTGS